MELDRRYTGWEIHLLILNGIETFTFLIFTFL